MSKNTFTADGGPHKAKRVLAVADGLRRIGEFESAEMLTAFAGRIEADERVVPDQYQYRFIHELRGGWSGWINCDKSLVSSVEGKAGHEVRCLFTQPRTVPDGWYEAVRTLLELVEDDHGGDHTEADCRHCRAVNLLNAEAQAKGGHA